MVAADDDIERLLREVESLEHGQRAQPPANAPRKDVAQTPQEDTGGMSRATWAALAALGGGAAGFVIGSLLFFLPGVDGFSTALGAALGAALVAFASGPPQRFR